MQRNSGDGGSVVKKKKKKKNDDGHEGENASSGPADVANKSSLV